MIASDLALFHIRDVLRKTMTVESVLNCFMAHVTHLLLIFFLAYSISLLLRGSLRILNCSATIPTVLLAVQLAAPLSIVLAHGGYT